jgi:Serine dehydrogenase proteinase
VGTESPPTFPPLRLISQLAPLLLLALPPLASQNERPSMNANPQEPPEPEAEELASEPESPRDRRKRLLADLRRERGSDVLIAYVTSTRPALEATMAQDAVRHFFDHLPPEPVKKLDLLIHSNGGDGVVPWRLMTLLHEYAEEVHVLVPHRAFSAATLAALGAHEITMHPMAMLGPIDASIVNPLGPVDPLSGQRVAVSGEDVAAYNALVRDDLGIRHEEELVQAFKILAENVHPLVLGSVKRGIAQSRMLGEKLIRLRSPQIEARHLELLEQLTTKLYYHGHPINRGEAKDLGLPVAAPAPAVENALWAAYLAYEARSIRVGCHDRWP